MKTVILFLLADALIRGVGAQALAPELAPLTTKYSADIAALETQRTKAISDAQKPYLLALANAEKSATAAGNVGGVSAINLDRAGMIKDLMSPGFPAGMPKELQNPRKTYLEAVARIRAAEAPRRQAIDATYLRALTSLGDKASKNPELAKQIADEKQKLLANAPATGKSKQSSKNAVVNGTFDVLDAQGHAGGWTLNDGFKVVRDGTNSVLHASNKMPAFGSVTQDIVLPPRARSVTLSGRVRGKVLARDAARSQGTPGVFVAANFLDKSESPTKDWIMNDGGSDMEWKTVTSTTRIPDDMKILQVALTLKYVSGEFDFDDIEVEFR